MSLSEFIVANIEPILAEWDDYARSIEGAEDMRHSALRDHAREMLTRIAQDMSESQSQAAQKDKSRGEGPEAKVDSAAVRHGEGRKAQGFDINQMVSEFRALRAAVVRLWIVQTETADRRTLGELIRFNEAIDQAIAESVGAFSEQLDQSRQLFLGMLGHDLRNPLASMVGAAHLLQKTPLSEKQAAAASMIVRAGRQQEAMIGDLLDVTRTRLGEKLPIELNEGVDLAGVCEQVAQEARDQHPGASVNVAASGDLVGTWDRGRLGQMLSNIVGNALQHGSAGTPVTIVASAEPDAVTVSVHNLGKPIPEAIRGEIFEPLKSGRDPDRATRPTDSLGLGLYIASQVAKAHHGSIAVDSTEATGTRFTVRLPRRRATEDASQSISASSSPPRTPSRARTAS